MFRKMVSCVPSTARFTSSLASRSSCCLPPNQPWMVSLAFSYSVFASSFVCSTPSRAEPCHAPLLMHHTQENSVVPDVATPISAPNLSFKSFTFSSAQTRHAPLLADHCQQTRVMRVPKQRLPNLACTIWHFSHAWVPITKAPRTKCNNQAVSNPPQCLSTQNVFAHIRISCHIHQGHAPHLGLFRLVRRNIASLLSSRREPMQRTANFSKYSCCWFAVSVVWTILSQNAMRATQARDSTMTLAS